MENLPKRSERKKLYTLEMAAALAAMISAADAAPAQAIEIPPNASWVNGVTHSVREASLREQNEQSAVYVQFTDGSGKWLSSVEGKAEEIKVNPWLLDQEAQRFGKPIENICLLHTHPVEFNRKNIQIPDVDPATIPMPPSGSPGDIETVRSKNLFPSDVHFTFGAADGLGVWYFSASSDSHGSVDEDQFHAKYTEFIDASVSPGFNMNVSLPKLQQAYRQYLHGEIRFVPYNKVENEAPCAGVHPSASLLTQSTPTTPHASPSSAPRAHSNDPQIIDLSQPTQSIRLDQ